MKKHVLLFLAAAFFMAGTAFSQLRTLPTHITDAFKDKFPEVKNTSWADKITSYEASFVMNNEKMQAVFDSSGKWQRTSKYMDVAKLPTAVSTGFRKSAYSADWVAKTAYETEYSDGKSEYRVLIEKAGQTRKYLYFDGSGKVIRDTPVQ